MGRIGQEVHHRSKKSFDDGARSWLLEGLP
jgi:hypothetical protein